MPDAPEAPKTQHLVDAATKLRREATVYMARLKDGGDLSFGHEERVCDAAAQMGLPRPFGREEGTGANTGCLYVTYRDDVAQEHGCFCILNGAGLFLPLSPRHRGKVVSVLRNLVMQAELVLADNAVATNKPQAVEAEQVREPATMADSAMGYTIVCSDRQNPGWRQQLHEARAAAERARSSPHRLAQPASIDIDPRKISDVSGLIVPLQKIRDDFLAIHRNGRDTCCFAVSSDVENEPHAVFVDDQVHSTCERAWPVCAELWSATTGFEKMVKRAKEVAVPSEPASYFVWALVGQCACTFPQFLFHADRRSIVYPAAEAAAAVVDELLSLAKKAAGERLLVENDVAVLDGKPYPLTPDASFILKKLVDARGRPVSSTDLKVSQGQRIDRIIQRMPPAVRSLIGSKTGTGYWITIYDDFPAP